MQTVVQKLDGPASHLAPHLHSQVIDRGMHCYHLLSCSPSACHRFAPGPWSPGSITSRSHGSSYALSSMTETQSPSPATPPTLETIPPEVLEHIAFSVATIEIVRPPTDLVSLCCASKTIHGSLSISGNPALYAAIFRRVFDVAAPVRRLGPDHTTAQCLASELRRRYEGMKRIRAGVGSRTSDATNRQHDLWMAIFMMLEVG